ncbi:MAG: hypothetical protein RL722_636 [Pseudomonadota bacterium]|jgi:capsular polysaccharide transport system permease protein
MLPGEFLTMSHDPPVHPLSDALQPERSDHGQRGADKSTMQRSALRITLAVWKALFLREALGRLFTSRGQWFWLLAEPAFHVAYLVLIYTVISVRNIGGIDAALWIVIGLLGFFFFRRTAAQVSAGIGANLALFAYRQVKPIDTLLVRAFLEGFLLLILVGVLMLVAGLFGHDPLPADPLAVLEAFAGLWLFGLGFGLVTSVAAELIPEFGRVVGFIMMPLYMVSGVMYPVAVIAQPYRDILMLNPLAHGLEAARLGFAPYYHSVPELDLGYLYTWAIAYLLLGLALQRRFALRLATQ